MLSSLPRLEANPFVVAGSKAGQHLVNLQKPWRRIRKGAQLRDVRIHDLRHNDASVAAGLGEGLPMIGKLLGHSQAQTTHRYAHLAADPVIRANERVGAAISSAMTRGRTQFRPLADRGRRQARDLLCRPTALKTHRARLRLVWRTYGPFPRRSPRTAGIPKSAFNAGKKNMPTVAPSLATLPAKPLAEARIWVGKSSGGRVKVVAFGPEAHQQIEG